MMDNLRILPAFLILAAPLWAEFLRIEMAYGGMECASCARFIENKFARNPGVESVSVDGRKGAVILKLKPGNTVRLNQVRDFVQQSGFTPKESVVVVRGVAQVDRGYTNFKIDGLDQTVRLKDPETLLRQWIFKNVEITGVAQVITHEGQKIELIEVQKAGRVAAPGSGK
jgi:cation transport ATPase